jgi:hypothetical protein
MYLKEIRCYGLDRTQLTRNRIQWRGYNEQLVSIKGGKIRDQLSDYQLLNYFQGLNV